MMQRHFKRRDGSTFTIEIALDHEKIATDMARKLASSGAKRATKMGGGVVATIVEDSRDAEV